MRRTLSLLIGLLALIATAFAGDEVWLNAAIQDALTSGRSQVTVDRDLVLDGPIRIPTGVQRFTLAGSVPEAGSFRRARITVNRWVGQAIQAGHLVLLHNNWGQWNLPNTNVIGPVLEGQTRIRLAAPVTPGKMYALWDAQGLRHRTSSSYIMFASELVRVVSFDWATMEAVLDVPAGRDYWKDPKLADVDRLVTRNVMIWGFEYDGTDPSTGRGTGGLASVCLAENVRVSNCMVRDFESGGVLFQQVRGGKVDQVDFRDASNLGPGGGYGAYIQRSRFVSIRKSYASGVRHGFVAHSGTMDMIVEDSKGASTAGADFDLHGMDERRVTFRRIVGGVGLGNAAWLLGGSGHRVLDSSMTSLYIGPGLKDTIIRGGSVRSSGMYPIMVEGAPSWSTPDLIAAGVPPLELAEVEVQSTEISAPARVIRVAAGHGARIAFTGVRFLTEYEFAIWGGVIGDWTFSRCLFSRRLDPNWIRGELLVVWDTNHGPLNVTLDDSRVESPTSSLRYFAALPAAHQGTVNMRRNHIAAPMALGVLNPNSNPAGERYGNTTGAP